MREVFKGLDHGVQAEVLKQVMGWEDCLKALSYCAWPPLGFPGATSGQELACQCRRYKRLGFDPWVRKIPWRRRRHGNPLQYSCLENPLHRGAWRATVSGVSQSRT